MYACINNFIYINIYNLCVYIYQYVKIISEKMCSQVILRECRQYTSGTALEVRNRFEALSSIRR